jgi:CDI immunity proteins
VDGWFTGQASQTLARISATAAAASGTLLAMHRPPRRYAPGVPIPDTIEGIERVREPDPGPDASNLVRRCCALRRKPLSQFTTEDLRIMLGQQIAVPILLPMAVAVLVDDPLAEGDYYPGDLLHNVVRLPDEHWHEVARLRARLVEVLCATPLADAEVGAHLCNAVAEFLRRSVDR